MTAFRQLQYEYTKELKPFFRLDFEELASRGIQEYLKEQFVQRELASFSIGKKYGVRTIDELDASLTTGSVKEDDIGEDDYIELAELQKEMRAIKHLLSKMEYEHVPA